MEKIEKSYVENLGNFTNGEFKEICNNNAPSKLLSFLTLIVLMITLFVLREIKKTFTFNKKTISKGRILYTLINILSIALFPFFILIIYIFALIKQQINIFLYLKYKGDYGGMVLGSDSIWATDETSKGIVNVLAILENHSMENLEIKIKKTIEKNIFSKPDSFPKLTCSLHSSFGYYFLMKNHLKVEDCIKSFDTGDDYVEENYLQYFMSSISNRELLNRGLWEILVSRKPFCENNTLKNTTYPVILRFSHIVGDGSSIVSLLLNCFSDNGIASANNLNEIATKMLQKKETNGFKAYKVINDFFAAPSVILNQLLFRDDNIHKLHVKVLSGNKYVAWKIGNIENNYIAKIKAIKNKLNVRFSDVVLSLIACSLRQLLEDNSVNCPKSITTVIPLLLDVPKYTEIPKLKNRFSLALIDLPILKNCSFVNMIDKIHADTEKLKNSPDYLVNYWLLNKIAGVLPIYLIKNLLKADKVAMCISNVPGTEKLKICDGCTLENVLFFPPHKGNAGINFSIMTYDNRLQLGIIADEVVLTSTECQRILDAIFENIQLFFDEVECDIRI